MVREFADDIPRAVVDLAGGEGRNALWFAAQGAQVENVEFSAVALEKFRQRAQAAELLGQITANLADAKTAEYQLVPQLLLICYLQLSPDELALALDNALRQLPAGAEIFGVWHSARNLTEGFGGPQNPQLLPTPDQLNGWIERNSLVGQVWEEEREVSTPEGTFTAIDVLLRAKRGD